MVVFEVRTYHQCPDTYNVTEMPSKNFIDEAWMINAKNGYEVGINFLFRWPKIEHSGGGYVNDDYYESIAFSTQREGYENIICELNWKAPKHIKESGKFYMCFKDIEKEQCIIYYIDHQAINSIGETLNRYKNPTKALLETFDKLDIKK